MPRSNSAFSLMMPGRDDAVPQTELDTHQQSLKKVRLPQVPAVEFWSSIEYGTFLRGLVRELCAAGCAARQRFVIGEQRYREARSANARIRLRLRSYAWYPFRLLHRLAFEPNPAAIVICSNTFYAPLLAMGAIGRRPVPVIHWIFDLYPDALEQTGSIASDGVVSRTLAKVTQYSLSAPAANVFIGDRLRTHAEERYGPIAPSFVLPIGTDARHFRGTPPRERDSNQALSLLYCGNLGRLHEFATLAAVLQQGDIAGWRIEFRAHGTGFRNFVRSVARNHPELHVGSSLGEDEWRTVMLRADVALVTVRSGAEKILFPSKVYSAMAAGQAILAICENSSDLADLVRTFDVGWIIQPGDQKGLLALLQRLAVTRGEVFEKRKRAFASAHEHFDQRVLARRWLDVLATLHQPKSTGSRMELELDSARSIL